MSIPLGDETVTVHPGPTYDDYGDPVPGSDAPFDVSGCVVTPRTSEEPTRQNRDGVIVGLSLYAPLGTVIPYTAQVATRGGLWDVEGEPGLWTDGSPYGGVQVALRRAQG